MTAGLKGFIPLVVIIKKIKRKNKKIDTMQLGKKGIGTVPLIVLAILGIIGILGATSMFMAARRPARPPAYTGGIEGYWVADYSDLGNISTTTTTDDTLKMGNYTEAYQTRLAGFTTEVDGLINTLEYKYNEISGTLSG